MGKLERTCSIADFRKHIYEYARDHHDYLLAIGGDCFYTFRGSYFEQMLAAIYHPEVDLNGFVERYFWIDMSFTLPLVMVMHDLEYLVQYDRDVSGNTYWWKRVQGAETNEFTIISGIVPGAFHFPTKRIPNSIFFLFTNGCHCESLLMT